MDNPANSDKKTTDTNTASLVSSASSSPFVTEPVASVEPTPTNEEKPPAVPSTPNESMPSVSAFPVQSRVSNSKVATSSKIPDVTSVPTVPSVPFVPPPPITSFGSKQESSLSTSSPTVDTSSGNVPPKDFSTVTTPFEPPEPKKGPSKKIIAGILLLFLALALPVGIYVSQNQQDIRQRAQTYGSCREECYSGGAPSNVCDALPSCNQTQPTPPPPGTKTIWVVEN